MRRRGTDHFKVRLPRFASAIMVSLTVGNNDHSPLPSTPDLLGYTHISHPPGRTPPPSCHRDWYPYSHIPSLPQPETRHQLHRGNSIDNSQPAGGVFRIRTWGFSGMNEAVEPSVLPLLLIVRPALEDAH